MTNLPLGTYRHYKGDLYEVLGVVKHSESREKLVLYKALYPVPDLEEEYGKEPMFVRPFDMFVETVEHEGTQKKRFELIT